MNQKHLQLVLRDVCRDDEALLFEWEKDPLVRKTSFNTDQISLSTHKVWFKEKLNSQDVFIWILECQGKPCGWVRIEKSGKEFKLHYLIAASHRGRKLSSVMLKMALNKVCTIFSEITLIAYILPDNMASYKALARAGFQLESEDTEKYTFIYECT